MILLPHEMTSHVKVESTHLPYTAASTASVLTPASPIHHVHKEDVAPTSRAVFTQGHKVLRKLVKLGFKSVEEATIKVPETTADTVINSRRDSSVASFDGLYTIP